MIPEISIIVPIYNVEKYLPKCIDSILTQTFTNFELILVDDGSKDKSGEICDGYAKEDIRIKVIHQKNGGVSAARNSGVEYASGNFVGFVDPDDYIDKNMYKNMHELCKNNNSDIAVCKLGREVEGKLINKNNGVDELVRKFDNVKAMEELFKGVLYRFSLCNKLFHKSCFNNVKFPEGRIHEDLSTTYKLFANAKSVVYTSYIGYIYVKRKESILTSKYNEKRLQAFIGWDEILKFISENYITIKEQVVATFTYWCIDNVYYITNQLNSSIEIKKYLKAISMYTKKYYSDIKVNKILSRRYKFKIKLLNINYKILILERKVKVSFSL